MRLMILIIALVLGTFMLLNALTQRKRKKHAILNEDFSAAIPTTKPLASTENVTDDLSEQDPLLDDLTTKALAPLNQALAPATDEEDLPNTQEKNSCEEDCSHREFIALTILPKNSGFFSASAIIASLVKNHFCFGKQKLYHRHIQDNPELPIMYSVGSLAKPGYFEPELKLKQSSPGILIYMALDIADPEQTFEKMLTCARQLSASLNAQICDEKRDPLSTLTLKRIREKIKKLHDAPQKELQGW